MKLVIFDPQQILLVALISVCIYQVTGCMHILRLYVLSLAFAAPQGTFQSQRNFWRVVRTPKTVLKSLSNSCRHISAVVTITLLEREQAPYLYLYPARGHLHLLIFILWGKMETSGFLSFDKCWQKEQMCNYFLTGLFRLWFFSSCTSHTLSNNGFAALAPSETLLIALALQGRNTLVFLRKSSSFPAAFHLIKVKNQEGVFKMRQGNICITQTLSEARRCQAPGGTQTRLHQYMRMQHSVHWFVPVTNTSG